MQFLPPDDGTSHLPLCGATKNIWVKFKTINSYTLCIIQNHQWLLSFYICTKVPNLLVLLLWDYLFITFLSNGTFQWQPLEEDSHWSFCYTNLSWRVKSMADVKHCTYISVFKSPFLCLNHFKNTLHESASLIEVRFTLSSHCLQTWAPSLTILFHSLSWFMLDIYMIS